MEQKIIQIGNSSGVIFPKDLMQEVGFATGEKVVVEHDKKNETVVIRKKGRKASSVSSSSRFFKIVEKVNKQYGPALKELANK